MIVEDVKIRINNLTNRLAAVHGYLELGEYAKVAREVKEAIKELSDLHKAIDLLMTRKPPKVN
jgi:hypothetical protein